MIAIKRLKAQSKQAAARFFARLFFAFWSAFLNLAASAIIFSISASVSLRAVEKWHKTRASAREALRNALPALAVRDCHTLALFGREINGGDSQETVGVDVEGNLRRLE